MRLLLMACIGCSVCGLARGQQVAFRVAAFNTSLSDDAPGEMLRRLRSGDDANARATAAVLKRVRPHIVLLNEFDFDDGGQSAAAFLDLYLENDRDGAALKYPHRFARAVNTGEPSGRDLDGDGATDGPGDAFGFGRHPGHYGMLVLSQFPIVAGKARTFRLLRWNQMPGALRPVKEDGAPFYDDATWKVLRLSSKSHWDIPIRVGDGLLHLLASHPTPPVFDGPEDRNGRRNHDEIRFWRDYLTPEAAHYIRDDQGVAGGLKAQAAFVLLGDLNADPKDGDGRRDAITSLLKHPRMARYSPPASKGARKAASDPKFLDANQTQQGDPAHDTAFFGRVGNLRVDHVAPSADWTITGRGVFWPDASDPDARWLEASDHRLVWVDLQGTPAPRVPK